SDNGQRWTFRVPGITSRQVFRYGIRETGTRDHRPGEFGPDGRTVGHAEPGNEGEPRFGADRGYGHTAGRRGEDRVQLDLGPASGEHNPDPRTQVRKPVDTYPGREHLARS